MNVEQNVELGRKLYLGVEEVNVLAFSPKNAEIYKLTGYTPTEEQEQKEYVGEGTVKIKGEDGEEIEEVVKQVQVDVWVKGKKSGVIRPITFYIKNKGRVNAAGDKKQYINQVGETTWVADDSEFSDVKYDWFKFFIKKDYKTGEETARIPKEYRQALYGEEGLYSFLQTYFELNRYNEKNDIFLDNSRLFKGNFTELNNLVEPYAGNSVIVAYSVKEKDYDDGEGNVETKQFQVLENRYFAPGKQMKQFRLYASRGEQGIKDLKESTDKKLYAIRKFVKDTTDGENGIKNFFKPVEVQEYEAAEFATAGAAPTATGSDY